MTSEIAVSAMMTMAQTTMAYTEPELEQLCRATYAAKRVFDLMRKLANHLPPRAVLDK